MFNRMVELVEERPEAIDAIFAALSHRARRAMVGRLAGDGRTGLPELSVGELAAPLPMSFEAASKHVRVLERAGLVVRRVDGRRHVCRLEPGALATVAAWLRVHERSWAASLDSLDELLQPIDD
jgi:DNA-binding transcriptional ArsR family regulator